jgi:hypothetical protein
MKYVPYRNKNLDSAKGFIEFYRQMKVFMQMNNFKWEEIHEITRLMNHFYKYGLDVENHHETVQEGYFKHNIPSPIPDKDDNPCFFCGQPERLNETARKGCESLNTADKK